MKKGWILAGAVVMSLSLTGCGANDNAGDNDNNGGGRAQINRVRPMDVNNVGNNRPLSISDRAERQVEQMDEVDAAHVIISNNNAYVAVRLADNNNVTGNRTINGNNPGTAGTRDVNNLDNNGNARVNDALDGNRRTLMENGTVNQDGNNRNASDGVIDGKGDAGTGNGQNAAPGNRVNNNGTSNNSANDGKNAAENATLKNNYSEVSNAFEQKVADQVRQADSRINKVYVSINPDLYNRMNTFADDIRTNRNRDGLFNDFNATVNDFFGNGRNR